MDALTIGVQLLAGALIGACIGMTGIGGGVLILPVLTLGFGLPSTVAVGTAHLYSFLCKLPAVFFHFKQGTVRLRTSLYFLVGALPVTVAVAFWITGYVGSMEQEDPAWFELQENLRKFIATVVILSGLMILWHMLIRHKAQAIEGRKSSSPYSCSKIVLVALLGAVIGGLIAATSVGSGILIVPLMIIIFGLSAVDTVGSSIFVALVLTFTSSIIYVGTSQVDFAVSLTMAAGSLIGVPAGVRMSRKIPERYLQIIITGLVLTAGVFMLIG